jgi:hypothetical protein
MTKKERDEHRGTVFLALLLGAGLGWAMSYYGLNLGSFCCCGLPLLLAAAIILYVVRDVVDKHRLRSTKETKGAS